MKVFLFLGPLQVSQPSCFIIGIPYREITCTDTGRRSLLHSAFEWSLYLLTCIWEYIIDLDGWWSVISPEQISLLYKWRIWLLQWERLICWILNIISLNIQFTVHYELVQRTNVWSNTMITETITFVFSWILDWQKQMEINIYRNS